MDEQTSHKQQAYQKKTYHKKTLMPIYRQVSLFKRFPQIRNISQLEKKQGQWILFGADLSNKLLKSIARYSPIELNVLDAWCVGRFQVLLMQGILTPAMVQLFDKFQLDCASIDNVPELTTPGLLVMDMDSTAIKIECIDEIAKKAGVGEKVQAITEQAMQGKLDFNQSLEQRLALLKGVELSELELIKKHLPITEDLFAVISTLKHFGWKTALVSGGFDYFAKEVAKLAGFDFYLANQLAYQDNQLTGALLTPPVCGQTKSNTLIQLADEWDIDPYNTLAVGDGANDLLMMEAAGLGIAYHAKPSVSKAAQANIKYTSLAGILCILSAKTRNQTISWSQK